MKLTSANFQKTYNLGNYESLKIGVELSVESSDTMEKVAEAAKQELDKLFVSMTQVVTPSEQISTAEAEPEFTTSTTDEVKEPEPTPEPTPDVIDGRKVVHKHDANWKKIVNRIKAIHMEGKDITLEEIEKYYYFEDDSDRNAISLIIQVKGI